MLQLYWCNLTDQKTFVIKLVKIEVRLNNIGDHTSTDKVVSSLVI